ncbi:PadR family transcriptional regulator [Occallatibacter riparius]|uniref:PadR family transcriptional regulator n=1 Tax=Occallatibacter riparius TaxID=1002689 RepID=A0A9J7BQ86_9BACT|nr:PadR family transcriptional regulator [Occallatibacter riparius]UWZ83102.1 PadR family transcriptional regulator [Occallatibacter riparius]
MPMNDMLDALSPAGALPMLILRVLQSESLHGYAIAQRIHLLSSEVLAVEEGLLYPTLQKLLRKGLVQAEWGISETNRKVRFYRLTPQGKAELKRELASYGRITQAIQEVLRTA